MPITKPIPIRLDDETVSRLDALAEAMSKRTGGAEISRANALRAALNAGLPVLEVENGLGKARQKPKARPSIRRDVEHFLGKESARKMRGY